MSLRIAVRRDRVRSGTSIVRGYLQRVAHCAKATPELANSDPPVAFGLPAAISHDLSNQRSEGTKVLLLHAVAGHLRSAHADAAGCGEAWIVVECLRVHNDIVVLERFGEADSLSPRHSKNHLVRVGVAGLGVTLYGKTLITSCRITFRRRMSGSHS